LKKNSFHVFNKKVENNRLIITNKEDEFFFFKAFFDQCKSFHYFLSTQRMNLVENLVNNAGKKPE